MKVLRVCFNTPQMRHLFLKSGNAFQGHLKFVIVCNHIRSSTISTIPL